MVGSAVARLIVLLALPLAAACFMDAESAKLKYLEEGDAHMAAERYPEAVIAYRNAAARNAQAGDVRHKLAQAYARAGNVEGAVVESIRAADLLPADDQVQLDAVRALLLVGRFDEARMRAEAVVARDPANVTAHILRGSASAGLNDWERALAAFTAAIDTDPTRAATYVNLGLLQTASGRAEEAEAAFTRAIEVDPQSIDAHLALAAYYMATGQPRHAEDIVERGLHIDPRHIGLNRLLARVYLGTGRAAAAESHLKTLAERSTDASDRLALADYYVSRNRPDAAIAILNDMAGRGEQPAAVGVRLGTLAYAAGDRALAHERLDAVLHDTPHHPLALVTKGLWLVQENRVSEALAMAEAATRADPDHADGHYLLGVIRLAQHDSDGALRVFNEALRISPAHPQALLQVAQLQLGRGAPAQAIALVQDAIRVRPHDPAARLLLVRALLGDGQIERARQELSPLLAATPPVPGAAIIQGEIHASGGDYEAARRSFQTALDLEPHSLEALLGVVRVEVAAGRSQEAVRQVEARLRATPDDPRALMLAARTYAATGAMGRAEASVRRAIDRDPSFMEAYSLLGDMYMRQQRMDEARREFEILAAKQPANAGPPTMIGLIFQLQGQTDAARAQYEEALARNPRAAVAANNLAYLLAEAGTNLDVALSLAEIARAELPDHADVDDTLGWVYYKRGLPELAVAPLQRSVQRNGANATYQFHLGLVYLQLKDQGRARTALQRALELGLPPGDQATARRALSEMR